MYYWTIMFIYHDILMKSKMAATPIFKIDKVHNILYHLTDLTNGKAK